MGIFETWEWLTGPVRPRVDELEERWKALIDWGLKEKLPELRPNWEDWERYQDRSLADRDFLIDHLNAQIDQLHKVEAIAKETGFGAPTTPIEHIDVERATADRAAAAGVRKTAEEAGKAVPKLPDIPWMKIGIGVGLGLLAIGIVGAWAAKTAAPYAVPLATGGAVRVPHEEAT